LTEIIRITKKLKNYLDKNKIIPRETYNGVITRLIGDKKEDGK